MVTCMYIYPGALHIHTSFSDGSGNIPDIAAAARAAGLRWIIITDHDTLAGQNFAGWHDTVLVIVGYEITPSRNHFLALNIDHVVSNTMPPQDFIDTVYTAGGFGIIAHPDEQVQNAFKEIYRWEDWTIDGPRLRNGRAVGLELWNIMSDWGEHLTARNKYLHYFVPRLGLTGPTPATLAWWDRLNIAGRRTFGVGGVDAHAFKHTSLVGTVEVFPYRWMFGTATNYLLFDTPLAADAHTAMHQVFAAMTGGRLYFANRLDGEANHVTFFARRNDERWQIGDTLSLADGPIILVADAGCDAYIRLIHNGAVLTSGIRMLRQSVLEPGIYRLEGYHGGRSWLYTNPIYVRG